MNRYNLKNRKILFLILCFIVILIFTLTIAYAALSTILTIQGNADIVASNWDIHLDNPVVKKGSTTMETPVIDGNSLSFNTTLSKPGDFFEFTVDVVNDGSIDAMIESVVKTPELTVDQAKYLKYEVSYQNGASITEKQVIAKGTLTPIKVRLEYRKDLSSSDLPNSTSTLNFNLTLVYAQNDGSESSISNNGFPIVSTTGDVTVPGTIVNLDTEQFYVIGTEGDKIKLLSMYNLYVGNTVTWSDLTFKTEVSNVPLINPTGIQDSRATASNDDSVDWVGVVDFSSSDYWSSTMGNQLVYVYNSNSMVYPYVQNYKNYLESKGFDIEDARLISFEELVTLGCDYNKGVCTNAPSWVYSSSYWTGTSYPVENYVWIVGEANHFLPSHYNNDVYQDYTFYFGIRPVIEVSKEYFS